MEDQIASAWAWLGREAVEFGLRHLVWASLLGIVTVFLGRRWRQVRSDSDRLQKRVDALEVRAAQPAISQTFNFTYNAESGPDDAAKQLREGMEGETVRSLRETLRRLTQEPFGDGHTYADLPDGTRIVSMADGTYRLALPVNIKVSFGGKISGHFPPGSATLTVKRRADDD